MAGYDRSSFFSSNSRGRGSSSLFEDDAYGAVPQQSSSSPSFSPGSCFADPLPRASGSQSVPPPRSSPYDMASLDKNLPSLPPSDSRSRSRRPNPTFFPAILENKEELKDGFEFDDGGGETPTAADPVTSSRFGGPTMSASEYFAERQGRFGSARALATPSPSPGPRSDGRSPRLRPLSTVSSDGGYSTDGERRESFQSADREEFVGMLSSLDTDKRRDAAKAIQRAYRPSEKREETLKAFGSSSSWGRQQPASRR